MKSKRLSVNKDYSVHLRLSKEHFEWLEGISKYYNCNIQQMIRLIIDNEYINSRKESNDI